MDKTLLHKTLFHLFDISWTVKDALVIGGGYDEAERHDGACRCRHSGWTTLPETVE